MESDLQQNQHNHLHRQRQQQQMNSGLMRYRSAPSSYFANFLESEDCEEFLQQNRASSPEAERIISRLFSGTGSGIDESSSNNLAGFRPDSQSEINQQNQFMMPSMKHETEVEVIQHQQGQGQSNYSSAPPQIIYQSGNQPPILPNQTNAGASNSMAMNRFPPMKMGIGSNSNLIRHSSSPAGLFSNLNIENGYVTVRGMGNFGGGSNNSTDGETSFSSPASRLKNNQMNFGSGPPSSTGLMSPISEHGGVKNMGHSSPENESFRENRGHASGGYIPGFPIGSWDDSAMMSENFSGLKRTRSVDKNALSGLNALETDQDEETGNRVPNTLLSHHLSLPKNSTEMASLEKLLQFQDSVPCKIRAKRGCATHPRSIAERVRRTRISERMRKLQELVPNMDKQTNTADMLDLAVDYIKDLQKQVKTLSDTRAKCTCAIKQKA